MSRDEGRNSAAAALREARVVCYIGPDKAGSTWIFGLLADHPEVVTPAAKEAFYFDRFYEKGPEWYLGHMRSKRRTDKRDVLLDVSHDYAFDVSARRRILEDIPNVELLVGLRCPARRAVSAFHFGQAAGEIHRSASFSEAQQSHRLIERGQYSRWLDPWIQDFGPKLHYFVLERAARSPQSFVADLYRDLGLRKSQPSAQALAKVNEAHSPRFPHVVRSGRRVAMFARSVGAARLVDLAKSARSTSVLYGDAPEHLAGVTRSDVSMLNGVAEREARYVRERLGLTDELGWGLR